MSEEDLHVAVPLLDEPQRRALERAEGWVGGDVNGVGIGATPSGDPCVVVYVRSRESEEVRLLPERCEGIPVCIEVSEEFSAQD